MTTVHQERLKGTSRDRTQFQSLVDTVTGSPVKSVTRIRDRSRVAKVIAKSYDGEAEWRDTTPS